MNAREYSQLTDDELRQVDLFDVVVSILRRMYPAPMTEREMMKKLIEARDKERQHLAPLHNKLHEHFEHVTGAMTNEPE